MTDPDPMGSAKKRIDWIEPMTGGPPPGASATGEYLHSGAIAQYHDEEAWLLKRREHLTGTDIAAIFRFAPVPHGRPTSRTRS